MTSVSADDVRDVINVTSTEVPDAKVLKREDFVARVESAGVERLAKMLRILGFLTQTKVYLFWKKHRS